MRKVPKLRFKEFSDEWEEKKLGDILEFKNGVNASKEQYGKGIKFINVLDILNNDFITYDNIIGKVDIDNNTVEKYSVTYGDILFQRSSETREEVGMANVYLDKKNIATFGGFVIRGKKIGEYIPIFLNKLLKTNLARNEITSKSGGSTRYNVGQETLKDVRLLFPILQEQEKIANFLTNIDKKISLTEKKLELFREYKKGVMQKIFSQELRFKDSNGNDYPEWEEKKLGEIAFFSKGKLISKEDITEEGVECIRYGELYTIYKEKIEKVVSKTKLEKNKLILSEKNDVIIPSSGETAIDIAVASCVMKDGVALGADLNIIKTKENGLYLAYFINNPAKLELASLAQGASVIHLYEKHLKLLNIKIPTLEEQEKIADFLSSIDSKIESIEKELEGLKEFKKGLLQQMFI